MVPIYHSEEHLKAFDGFRSRKFTNCSYFRSERGHASSRNSVTEEVYRFGSKHTFVRADNETVVPEKLKNDAKMHNVVFTAFAEDEDVVDKNHTERHIAEDGIHETLKRSAAVSETESRKEKHVSPERSYDGRFLDVVRVHRHLEVPFEQIQFRKNLCALYAGKHIKQGRRRVAIGNSHVIQTAIITTRS